MCHTHHILCVMYALFIGYTICYTLYIYIYIIVCVRYYLGEFGCAPGYLFAKSSLWPCLFWSGWALLKFKKQVVSIVPGQNG